MESLSIIQKIIIWAIPVLFAITLHEVAHGYMAYRLGDGTAKFLGRLSLNPIRHVDPIGTLLIPALLLLMRSPVLFGWAKPVPINWHNLRKPHRDIALVAAAGPGANFIMALFWGLFAKIGLWVNGPQLGSIALPIILMGAAGIAINTILMVLNLIPIPPLDGSRILTSLLPANLARTYNRIEPFGFFIVLILLLTKVLYLIISPLYIGVTTLIYSLFDLPLSLHGLLF